MWIIKDSILVSFNCPFNLQTFLLQKPQSSEGGKSEGGTTSAAAMKQYDMGEEPERKPFLDKLFSYLEDKGSPITAMPMISKNPIDLYKLYIIVKEKGGLLEVSTNFRIIIKCKLTYT